MTPSDGWKGNPNLFEIAGTQVRPKGAPYAVEMRVAKFEGSQKPNAAAFQPRAVEVRDGRPFLPVKPGEVIAVRIINDADHEVCRHPEHRRPEHVRLSRRQER